MQDDSDTPFGLNLTDEQYDQLMFTHVRKEWQDYEVPLFGSKWFDYRFMNPVAATYLYAAEFVKVYRAFFRSTMDSEAAPFIKPLKDEDLFKCPQATITALWRGRQHADAIGIPYAEYLTMAMEAALKYWKRSFLPRPAQLYSDRILERVIERWADRQRGFLFAGAHYAYRMQAYVGLQAQNDHHEWLLDQVTKRQNPMPTLIELFDEGYLPIDKIKLRFGDDVSQRVLEAA